MLAQTTTPDIRILHLAAGQEIFGEGARPNALYQVELGTVKLLRSSSMGRDTITEVLGSGDYFDLPSLMDGGDYLVGAYVVSTGPARLRRIERQAALSDPALLREAQEQYWERLRFQRQLQAAIACERVEQRALMALTRLGERCGVRSANGRLTFPMSLSRQELGELIGTTTETAIRVLSDLRKRGLLEEENRFLTLKADLGECLLAG